jgi:hypothetical protein
VPRKQSVLAVLASALIATATILMPGPAFANAAPAAAAAPPPGADGPYELIEANNTSKCLDDPGNSTANGTVLDIYTCIGSTNEQWYIEAPSDGTLNWYWLVNVKSGKCMTVQGAVSDTNKPIIQYTCTTGSNEEWSIVRNIDSEADMIARNSGKCATVKGDLRVNNTPLLQYPCNDGGNQTWLFRGPPFP